LTLLWQDLDKAFQDEVQKDSGSVSKFFSNHRTPWNLVGKVCFHLAENKGSEETPFAFLATYSQGLSALGRTRYLPLGKALQEYAGEEHRAHLLQLLL